MFWSNRKRYDSSPPQIADAIRIYRERKVASMDALGFPAETGVPDDSACQSQCGHCGLSPTPEGYDGCIGHIPGIDNACCGHGRPAEAYLQDANGLNVAAPDLDSTAIFTVNDVYVANRLLTSATKNAKAKLGAAWDWMPCLRDVAVAVELLAIVAGKAHR